MLGKHGAETDDGNSPKRVRVLEETALAVEESVNATIVIVKNDPAADTNENAASTAAEAAANGENGKCNLRIGNLDKNLRNKGIQKLLTGYGVEFKKAISFDKDYALVTFVSHEQREAAIKILTGKEYKGKEMTLERLKERSREFKPPKIQQDDTRSPAERIADQVTPLWKKSYAEQLADKQGKMTRAVKDMASRISKFMPRRHRFNGNLNPSWAELKEMDPEDRACVQIAWLKGAKALHDNAACNLLPIEGSPVINGYRNKCEFTFGVDIEGKPTLGFLLGLFKDGLTTVLGPKECLHVSDEAKSICNVLQTYAAGSGLEVYNRTNKIGFWRSCLVRTQTTGECMVMVQVHPAACSASELDKHKAAVCKVLVDRSPALSYCMTSIYFQLWAGDFNGITDKAECQLIHGNPVVVESLLGLQFAISPTSFFQVNTRATEVLYQRIREMCMRAYEELASRPLVIAADEVEVTAEQEVEQAAAESDSKATAAAPIVNMDLTSMQGEHGTTALANHENDAAANPIAVSEEASESPGVILLDVCCGTGTIGISMASKVKKVIGVDMVAEAIEDAKKNALANGFTCYNLGIDNIVFYCAKVEDVIYRIVKDHVKPGDQVIAVLDPPRCGLHYSVIRTLRGCAALRNVIFVSCDVNQSMQNLVDLCRPFSNKFKGWPFVPRKAIPFDLFPHTAHCELITEFERQEQSPSGPGLYPHAEPEINPDTVAEI